jgi:hypothetical protein
MVSTFTFFYLKDLALYLLSCSSRKHKSMEIGNMVSIIVVFILINPRTSGMVLLLLYYA